MLSRESKGLVAYFMKAYPKRTLIMILCLIIAGLAEGISVTILLPLLDINMGAANSSQSSLSRVVADCMRFFGLEPRFEMFLMILVIGISMKSVCAWLVMRQVGYTVAHVIADLRMKLIGALLNLSTRAPSKPGFRAGVENGAPHDHPKNSCPNRFFRTREGRGRNGDSVF